MTHQIRTTKAKPRFLRAIRLMDHAYRSLYRHSRPYKMLSAIGTCRLLSRRPEGQMLGEMILAVLKNGVKLEHSDLPREALKLVGTPCCTDNWVLQWQVSVHYLDKKYWLSVNCAALYALKRLVKISPIKGDSVVPGWKANVKRLAKCTDPEVKELALGLLKSR